MGISAVMVHWLARLHDLHAFMGADSIVELGPQDIMTTRSVIRSTLGRLFAPAVMDHLLNEMFDGNHPTPFAQRALYRQLGMTKYRSIDLCDHRADWRLDLNYPCELGEKFSVVTNFGSSEHVFDIAQTFRTVNDLLTPGGIALFVLPTFGDINHGFWNIHPSVYFDISKENNYSIIDFSYVDNFGVRCRASEECPDKAFNFDELPIKYTDCLKQGLPRIVTKRFLDNLTSFDTERLGKEFSCFVFDYCFVAMRKPIETKENGFTFPTQGIYRAE